MKIALFTHELVPEIGHSRALIETINHIPSDKIDHLYVVSFEMGNPQEIFPELKNRITFIEVPKLYFGPFLIKMLYFFIASWFITKLKLSSDVKKVGIGIASLSVDYVNVQFVHKEWEHFYFSRFKFPIYKYLYKKLLFFFFWLGENYLYRIKSHTQFSILSEFEQDYMTTHFNIPKEHTILNYSGINLDNFDFINESKEEVLNELISDYPQMTKLELNQPIYLFVGAFERKGLNLVIDKIRSVPNAQLLVVGRPESAKGFSLPDDLNITYVEFTKRFKNSIIWQMSLFFPQSMSHLD
ncbi:hypothetical protein [Bacteriovorax sp. DB6_IX]|uniref:hypothetical protein n=1 Tax=Bacteriovorax sp. DB6_IX TaxID=1353530 RepID=UPI00038A508A|nr:hypothetical protein [Bacteriovorax sp. DB6_IX]EQC52810.1 hypothetical protein M901_2499 [Bacteriovorax sp. DB6_IX]